MIRWAATAGLLAVRGVAAERRGAAAALLVVAVATGALAAGPRAFEAWRADGLEGEAAAAPPRERDVEIVQAARLPTLAGAGEERFRELPASVQALVGETTVVVDAPRSETSVLEGTAAPSGTTRFLTVRLQRGLDGHVRWTDGAAPGEAARDLEVAVSARTAEVFGAAVGDRLLLEPVFDQPLLRHTPFDERRRFSVRVAGVFEPRDAAERYWFGDPRALEPVVEDTETQRLIDAWAVLPENAYEAFLARTGGMPLTYRWRGSVVPARLDAGATEPLARDLRRLELRAGAVPETGAPDPRARTGLARILERHEAHVQASASSLLFAAVAFLALAVVVLVTVALAGGEGRRAALALARDRGASRLQLAAAALAGAALVVLPAAALGFAAALLVPGGDTPWAGRLAALAAGAGLAATALAALPSRRRPADPAEAAARRERLARMRAAAEGLLVVLAATAVWLVRQEDAGAPRGVDPSLAAAPALLVLVAWALVARVLPAAASRAAASAAQRPDLVPALALRRASRRPRGGELLLGVSLTATATATFAGALLAATPGSSPLVEGVRTGLRLVAGLGLAYAAAGIALAVVVAARRRAQEDAFLAAVGVTPAQALAAALVESVPAVAAGAVAGIAVAVAAAAAVGPALDLAGAGETPLLPGVLEPALALVLLPAAAVAGAVLARRVVPLPGR